MQGRLHSILIVKLSAIGDVVHTLPLLEVLRKSFPEARIDWLVEEEASEIIQGHPDLSHVFISQRKSWQRRLLKRGSCFSSVAEITRFLRKLRSQRYDLVIDLQGLFRSGLLVGISRGARKMGFSGGREGSVLFLTERPYPVNYNLHAIERYLQAAEYLECRENSWKGIIPVPSYVREKMDVLLSEIAPREEKLVAINPMARWETKLWDPERFAILAERIERDLSHKVLFTGSSGDVKVIEKIMGRMHQKPINLAGKTTLKELAHLYSRCRLVVTTDTGPMHIAAAMGTPVLALFGPTAPWRTGPYGERHRVIREVLPCSPCFKKQCSHRSCMKGIGVDQVVEVARQTLQ